MDKLKGLVVPADCGKAPVKVESVPNLNPASLTALMFAKIPFKSADVSVMFDASSAVADGAGSQVVLEIISHPKLLTINSIAPAA